MKGGHDVQETHGILGDEDGLGDVGCWLQEPSTDTSACELSVRGLRGSVMTRMTFRVIQENRDRTLCYFELAFETKHDKISEWNVYEAWLHAGLVGIANEVAL